MYRKFNSRRSGSTKSYSGGGGRGFSNSNKPGFSGHKRKEKYTYTWSADDLVKSVEYSKTTKQVAEQSTEDKYVPTTSFETLPINYQLKQNILKKGYTIPTPVQDQTIPAILEGKDVIGIANTGTGKTAAFLIPFLDKVSKDRHQRVLIVTPTRELAEQIYDEFRAFEQGMKIYCALVIGGRNMGAQIAALRQNPNFVIGTPGRIKDLIKRNMLNLGTFNNVVLDETDRMVDIGFLPEIKYFISLLPPKRQSLFFSATVSIKVEDLIYSFVKAPITISVKKQDTSINIAQDVVKIKRSQSKIDQLHNLLAQAEFEKVIIFGNTKWDIQRLTTELAKRGHNVDCIHGDKRQSQRHTTLEKFKTNKINVLLATDVAARGLDISDVSHVINYDMPKTYDEYIHRIGRTGRANKKGVALTFIEY